MFKINSEFIAYKDTPLVERWDDDVIINWHEVKEAIEEISITDLIKLEEGKLTLDTKNEFQFVIKGFCLALMFSRNYGFLSNLDIDFYNAIWKDYKNKSTASSNSIYDSEIILSDDIQDASYAVYEDVKIIDGMKFTMYATVDWKSVIKRASQFENSKEIDSLIAVSLLAARKKGLNEGKSK